MMENQLSLLGMSTEKSAFRGTIKAREAEKSTFHGTMQDKRGREISFLWDNTRQERQRKTEKNACEKCK